MSDKELEEYIRTIDAKFESHIEKGTIEMTQEYYNLVEERTARLINENQQFKKIKGKNQRTEDVLRQILKYCNYLHNDCKYRLNDGHIRKIRKIIRDYFGEEDNE